ncbi:MAG: hypothetical protein AAB354_16305 [candidate division KSB1 bacterium]
MKSKKNISKKRLQQHIDELVAIAKSVTPDVKVDIQVPGYEDQHAWVEICVPDEMEEQLYDRISQRAHDIFIDTGYDIGALVYEKSQLQENGAATLA